MPTTKPDPAQPKTTRKSPDAFGLAAKLARRLDQLAADERDELEASPASIKAKYAKKANEACAQYPDAIVVKARGMLGAEVKAAAE